MKTLALSTTPALFIKDKNGRSTPALEEAILSAASEVYYRDLKAVGSLSFAFTNTVSSGASRARCGASTCPSACCSPGSPGPRSPMRGRSARS